MRTRRTPSRLEVHRLKYNQDGRKGQLLRVSDLDDYEKEQLNSEILKDVKLERVDFTGEMDEEIFDGVQARVFAEWGVMCPHGGQLEPSLSPMFGYCVACGSLVFSITRGQIKHGKLGSVI